MSFEGSMVIPVCFKCEHPIKIISVPESGLELINYHCTHCNHTSARFLLGYLEPVETEMSQEAPDPTQRAELFSQAAKNYKLRAKMQTLVDFRNDGYLQANTSDTSPDTT